jgi:hypothetical protein
MLNGENDDDDDDNNNNNNNNKIMDKMTSDLTKLRPTLLFATSFLQACLHFCFFIISLSSHCQDGVV